MRASSQQVASSGLQPGTRARFRRAVGRCALDLQDIMDRCYQSCNFRCIAGFGLAQAAAGQELVDEAGMQMARAEVSIVQNLPEELDVGLDTADVVFAESALHAGD